MSGFGGNCIRSARNDANRQSCGPGGTTTRAIEILLGCSRCTIKVTERDCHQCDVLLQHSEVPDVVECAIFKGTCSFNGEADERRLP